MGMIDTSDWSVVEVLVGDVVISVKTIMSEEYHSRFCEKHGYKLLSFCKGTNPHCA